MPLYRIFDKRLTLIPESTFAENQLKERYDLQEAFSRSVEFIVPDSMVIAKEFGEWEDSRRRIDLLCLTRNADLIVVEFKAVEEGGHMELQALRYAAMISKMTFSAAVRAHKAFLASENSDIDAEQSILDFLGWSSPTQEAFGSNVSIVLVSPSFSKELTTSVLWLREFEVDIKCIKVRPYRVDDSVLLNVEQIVPLPEASEYQVKVREKEREERVVRGEGKDYTRFNVVSAGEAFKNVPKRRLAFLAIAAAIRNGAAPPDVLESRRRWAVKEGNLTPDQFMNDSEFQRLPMSSDQEIDRFFTAESELFHFSNKTYALTKMWGADTVDIVSEVIARFPLGDFSFTSVDG